MKKINTIEVLRRAVKASSQSRYHIAQKTGVSESQLCRLIKGKTLRLETAEKLWIYFGYSLEKKESPDVGTKTEKTD